MGWMVNLPIHPTFCLEVIRSQRTVFPNRGGFADLCRLTIKSRQ